VQQQQYREMQRCRQEVKVVQARVVEEVQREREKRKSAKERKRESEQRDAEKECESGRCEEREAEEAASRFLSRLHHHRHAARMPPCAPLPFSALRR